MEPEPAPDHETAPVQGAPAAAGGEGPDHTLVSVHRVVFPAPAGTGCLGGLIILIIELSLVGAFNKEEAYYEPYSPGTVKTSRTFVSSSTLQAHLSRRA